MWPASSSGPDQDQARMALGPQRREPMGHGPSRQPRHRQARRGQRRDSIGISRRTVEGLKGSLIPAGVEVSVTRNYGETANEKANELIFHLALATVSIVVLIGFAIGWREAAVTPSSSRPRSC
jgi:hypothetical protein